MSSAARKAGDTYVSGYDRLKDLPPVFSLNTLVRATGMNRASAKVALTRWAAKKMIEGAGPRAGIYFNRVVDRNGDSAHSVKALLMKYPSATLCGASILHSAGWTTQIPSTLHVAVEARSSYVQIDGATLFPRPVSWFQFMQAQVAWVGTADTHAPGNISTYGLRALAPAWALADLYADKSGHAWYPDEDDLDVPRAAMAALRRACKAMQGAPAWLLTPRQ